MGIKRILSIVGISCLLVFLGGISFSYWYFHVEVKEEEVQAILRQYSAQIVPAPNQEENRIFGYLEVFKEFRKIQQGWSSQEQRDWEDLENFVRGSFKASLRDLLEKKFSEAKRKELLQRFQSVREQLVQVLKREKAAFPFHSSGTIQQESKEIHLVYFIDLNRFVLGYGTLLAEENEWQKVWPLLSGNLILAQDLCSSSALLQQLTCRLIIEDNLQFIFAHLDKISRAGFPAVDAFFQQIQESFSHMKPFEGSLRAELYSGSQGLEKILSSPEGGAFGLGRLPKFLVKRLFEQDRKLYWKRQLRRIEIVQSSFSPLQKFQALSSLEQKKSIRKWAMLTPLIEIPLANTYGDFLRSELLERSVPILQALARFFNDHSNFPHSLEELQAKEYLREIPVDLFHSGKIHYLPQDGGFLLYSAGWNGMDEKGEGDDIVLLRN